MYQLGNFYVLPRILNGKGKIYWRTAGMHGDDWTISPNLHDYKNSVFTKQVYCPNCGMDKNANNHGCNIKGKWLSWGCLGCKRKASAKQWECGCGQKWHLCPKHILVPEVKGVLSRARKRAKRQLDGPAPGPEPKCSRPAVSKATASQTPPVVGTSLWVWRPPPGSILALRFPNYNP